MRLGLAMNGGLAATRRLAQQRQRCLHFVPRMHVARLLRNDNAVGKHFPRLFEPPQTRKQLAELEVSRE